MHTTLDSLLSAQALAHELVQGHYHLMWVSVATKVCKTQCKGNRLSRK